LNPVIVSRSELVMLAAPDGTRTPERAKTRRRSAAELYGLDVL
jgi:hypothetical protein